MPVEIVSATQQPTKNERGGEMRILLSPRTVNTQSGFMGTLTLQPGGVYLKHYHPYSDEYLYVLAGEVCITDDQEVRTLQADTGVFIPRNMPHRLENQGTAPTTVIFFSTPLAPRPDLGHVMLEE